MPDIDKFHSSLTGENISQEDYQFGQKLWETFDLKNIGKLHDFYMETDVCLLGDVFEIFKKKYIGQLQVRPSTLHDSTRNKFCSMSQDDKSQT